MPDTLLPTLADLRTELGERGFYYLSQTRTDRFLNNGQHALCLEDEWPFLITTTSPSTAPITLTDAREVHSVYSSTVELSEADRDDLNDSDPALAQTGTAQWFWRDGNTLRVYPLDASTTWTVRYLRFAPTLVNAGDIPIVPDEWRFLIIEYAAMYALRDRSNYQEAQATWDALQPDLNRMREALVDLPWTQQVTGSC